jgi:hypothetical protein
MWPFGEGAKLLTNLYTHTDEEPLEFEDSIYHFEVSVRETHPSELERKVNRLKRPPVVCLCGSTRFWREFQKASLQETLDGKIVLSIGAASGTDDEHFGNLPKDEFDRVKRELDILHLRKIDMADEVLILNVGGYIGESTRNELQYAVQRGKTIRYLAPQSEEEGNPPCPPLEKGGEMQSGSDGAEAENRKLQAHNALMRQREMSYRPR